MLAAPDLLALINHFRGTQVLTPPEPAGVAADAGRGPDLSDVKGQESAKRALEIAAAGGHNLLMIGPPGAGKSMLAARLPGLLPALDAGRGAGGQHDPSRRRPAARRPAGARPPFREPHHSASQAALIGGGAAGQAGRDRPGP